MTQRELALVIAVVIPVVGILIEFFRAQSRLRGFREMRKNLQKLAVDLNGEIDRDDDDLLIRGHYGHWPVLIRFSRSEYEAGTSIQMPVPANVTLYCYPVAHQGDEGQTPLRISDERFMQHFRLSTNNSPLEVSMILSSPAVVQELSKITDSQTYLTLENRTLELAEAVIAPEDLGTRLMNRVRGMARIANEAAEVHGSPGIPATHKPGRNWFRVGYVTASALILTVLVVSIVVTRPEAQAESVAAKPSVPAIPAAIAAQIPQLEGWHTAEAKDFDIEGGAWLQQQGQRISGHISTSIASDQSRDDAYVFKRPAGPPGTNSSRFVLFINGQKNYDAEMPQIDAVASISKDALGSVEWRGRPPSGVANASGIVVIQRYRDPSSALIFYMSGPRLLTGVPKDFRSLTLE